MKPKTERIVGPTLCRRASVEKKVDTTTRSVVVSFSSETPYVRDSWFDEPWIEVLDHSEEAVDLSRLLNGAPVLYNHSRWESSDRLGVVEKAWLEDGRGYAELRFSNRADVDGVWQDIEDGILKNVSVGYAIHERQLAREAKDGPSEYRVTRWEPMEISIVDIPADPTVGVGRSKETGTEYRITAVEDGEMPDQKEIPEVEQRVVQAAEPAPAPVDVEAVRQKALAAEKSRRFKVRHIFQAFADRAGVVEAMDSALDDPAVDETRAREVLLEVLGRGAEPLNDVSARIETGESQFQKFHRGAESALLIRAGLAQNDERNEFRGLSLHDLARRSLELRGVRTSGLDRMDLIGRAFTHSSSDFPTILANVASKAMLKGWEENAETFEAWTARGSLPDFKIAHRVDLNLFPSLPEVPEGGEFSYGTIGERGETIQLATYGRLFSITRQAVINDDLSAFSRIPTKMGRAAKRTIGSLVYAVLTNNDLMSDGIPLFDAQHGNIGTAAAPTTASFDEARTLMATQKDPDSYADGGLNIRPSYVLAPVALEGAISVVLASEREVTASNRNNTTPNSVRGMATLITDARLDADSTTAYYFAANPSTYDGIEVSYLDGNSSPMMEQQRGWNVDGTEFKVRIDAGVKALDYRTFVKNAGA